MTDIKRNAVGRFESGQSGNPMGRPKMDPEKRVQELVTERTPELLIRAYEQAKTDDAVLAALLNFMAAALGETDPERLQSQISALAVGSQPRH